MLTTVVTFAVWELPLLSRTETTEPVAVAGNLDPTFLSFTTASPKTTSVERANSQVPTSTPSSTVQAMEAEPVDWSVQLVMLESNAPFVTAAAVSATVIRSEEHTSELQSLMRISYAVFCLKKKTKRPQQPSTN